MLAGKPRYVPVGPNRSVRIASLGCPGSQTAPTKSLRDSRRCQGCSLNAQSSIRLWYRVRLFRGGHRNRRPIFGRHTLYVMAPLGPTLRRVSVSDSSRASPRPVSGWFIVHSGAIEVREGLAGKSHTILVDGAEADHDSADIAAHLRAAGWLQTSVDIALG
jgi:hypothetical protein